ncbi:unnamed protein product [Rotaria magnacalcarata]
MIVLVQHVRLNIGSSMENVSFNYILDYFFSAQVVQIIIMKCSYQCGCDSEYSLWVWIIGVDKLATVWF